MRSIPAAITWELLWHGRWSILATTLAAAAFPMMVLTALRSDGALDPQDKSMLIMHFVMVLVIGLTCGSQLTGTQGKVLKLYAYPLRSSAIVAWKLIPAVLVLVAQMVICIAAVNWLFELDWPIWGPVLWTATMFSAVQAACWLTEKSAGWLLVAISVVGAILGLWFKSRYGPAFSDPTHYWVHLTAAEVFTMAAMAGIAYWIAVVAVARNRRGEPPLSLGLIDRLARWIESWPSMNPQPKTPFEAQCWCEWQRKGWAMPFAAVTLIVIGLIVWLFGSRNAEDLFDGFLIGGGVMWLLGFIGGLLLGNAGPRDDKYEIGHFLATRPISDTDLARAILRTAVKSIVATWLIWVTSFLIVCTGLWAFGASSTMKIPPELNWCYWPGTLFGPWIVAGILMSLGLMGRPKVVIALAIVVPMVMIVTTVVSKTFLTRETQLFLSQIVAFTATAAVITVAIWAVITARKRGFIQHRSFWAVVVFWSGATVALASTWPLESGPRILGYLLVAAIVALIVVPVAAVPLALSWNRHR